MLCCKINAHKTVSQWLVVLPTASCLPLVPLPDPKSLNQGTPLESKAILAWSLEQLWWAVIIHNAFLREWPDCVSVTNNWCIWLEASCGALPNAINGALRMWDWTITPFFISSSFHAQETNCVVSVSVSNDDSPAASPSPSVSVDGGGKGGRCIQLGGSYSLLMDPDIFEC